MADRVWIEEAAEKGRIVKPARQNPLSNEQVLSIFGWGLPSSIWANPCECQGMDEFKGLKPSEMTERVGFLLWDAATTQNLEPQEIKIDGVSYMSLCGYKELLPHLHNFNNSAEAIKYLEELLIDELTFHLFGVMGYSTRGLGGSESMDVTGYAIRFAELTVTPKDNMTEDFKEPVRPTNRVARSRIYGAILVPKAILEPTYVPEVKLNVNTGKVEETGKMLRVSGAKEANPLEVIVDPRREPDPIRKVTKPPPAMPRFTLTERRRIGAIPAPVSQFGLSPEKVREEQLKMYTIAEIEHDNNLAIADPKAGLAAKLIRWRSKCPKAEILKSLKYNSFGSPIFLDEDPERGIPAGGMWFVSVLTNISKKVHPDPEFLYYDGEHDSTIDSCMRSLYNETLTQQEVIRFVKGPLYTALKDIEFTYDPDTGYYHSPKWGDGAPVDLKVFEDAGNEYEVVTEEHPKFLVPPQRDLFNLADDIGYLSTGEIPEAYYEEGKKVTSWIITVGIQASKLEEAEEAEYSDPNQNQNPPQNKFDWLPMVGQGTWKVRTLQEVTIYKKSKYKSRRKRKGIRVKEVYYYAYLSDEEYLSLKFDPQKVHDTRDRAVFKLYESLPSPRLPDYKVADFKFAPMPFSGKAVVLVGVRKDWIDNQPYKKNSKPKKLPPVVTKPKLKNNERPFVNWQHTHAPFPTWHDSNRESYYSIKEATSNVEFMDADTGEIDMKLCAEALGSSTFQEICSYYGKVGTPVARISDLEYFQYFKNRNNAPIDVKTWLPPKPYSSPRAIVGVREEIIDNLPNKSQIPSWQEIEKYNEDFIKNEKYLILRIPVASHAGIMSFWRRMQITAKSLRDMAKGLGGGKRSPQGLTKKEMLRASKRVSRFLDDFNRTVLAGSELRPDASSREATESVEKGTACEFYLYLDPADFSVKDVFAYTGQRCTKGVAEFKALWAPPHNVAMQFVFWSGMTYVKTNHGRSDKFDFFDLMNIMMDPFGALGDWFKGFPDIPGLPEGFVGQSLANGVKAAQQMPPKPPDGYLTAEDLKKIEEATEGSQKYAAEQIQKRGYYKMNPDTSNPGAVHEDPMDLFEGLSAAGCGSDLMAGILSKVNIFSLIMMYLKCLGIELPIDPRCLFTFPWPLFDLNIRIPWFTIPYITLADILEIIRKILYQMLCALIIELMLMLVKEILEAVLNLPGCAPTADGMPALPEAPFDFGPFDPEDMIEDAMKEALGALDPLDPDKSPDDFANNLFAQCQQGLEPSDYGAGRSALTYFKDVSKILTGVEFCSLMNCEPNRDVIDRVIKYTKEEYPDLYYKKQSREDARKGMPKGSWIGYPREPGSPMMYRNFWCCVASVLKPQVNDICDPDALIQKYGQPNPAGDDKCDPPLNPSNLNDKLAEIWKDRGLSPDDIKELIADADKEITKKLLDMDAIQAAIDEFLEVEVPKVTAPVVDAILMNAFDQVFKPVAIEMRNGVERIKTDAWEPDDDLLMMINYVVNAENVEVHDRISYYRVWRRRGWWWYRQKKYYRKFFINRGYKFNELLVAMGHSEQTPPDCKADEIFLHDKFKVKTQVWPDPWLPDWIQDALTFFLDKKYEMIIPSEIRNMYKAISLRDAGQGPHDRNVRRVHGDHGLFGVKGQGKWRDSRWWRDRRNLAFLQEYAQGLGNLADTIPKFSRPANTSERLEVGNGKFAFSVELDKDGNTFTYDLYESGGDSFFDKKVEVNLNRKYISAETGEEEENFPWWHDRKGTKANTWIQREEFFERFVPDSHPLRTTTEWKGLTHGLFDDMHLNFYEEEVKRSVIEPLRRSPMEYFWLEEMYKAKDFEDWTEIQEEDLVRNRVFNSDDPYIKMADIRQQAKEILEGE